MPRLLVINAKIALDFHFERAIVIGRHVSSSLPLPDSEVSRRHAQISPRGDAWVVTDLGSSNGIFINGEQVDDAVLQSGDEVITGGTIILFEPPQRAKPKSLLSRHGKQIWKTFEEPETYEPAHVAAFSPVELDEVIKGWLTQRPVPGRLELPILVKNEALQIALALDRKNTPGQLAEDIIEKIRLRLGGDRLTMHTLTPDKKHMHLIAAWSNKSESPQQEQDTPREVLRVCLEAERAVYCRDVDADYRFRHLAESPRYSHVQSFLAIPLVAGQHYTGFLYCEAHRGGARYDFDSLVEAYLYTSLFAK
ncbi:MAG: FHA domain-containing protein, partial [Candidatus Sumerlaeota bacterium]